MKKLSYLVILILGISLNAFAQEDEVFSLEVETDPPPASETEIKKTPKAEFGLHAGHIFTGGNVDFLPSFAGGIHIRRSLDYVFSVRLDLAYGQLKGEDQGNVRNFSNNIFAGSVQLLASLNNLKWAEKERRINAYLFLGAGLNNFDGELEEGEDIKTFKNDVSPHFDVGPGISFRINDKMNIGMEHKFQYVIGKNSDKLDGVETIPNLNDNRSSFHDVINYTNVRMNFNLGKMPNKTEPLYWLNPLDAVLTDVNRLIEEQVKLDDADGDGIIDALDEEEFTPPGAAVNIKGVTLDSDRDGYPDYRDREPYSPAGYPINKRGVAQLPNLREEVKRLVAEEMKNYQAPTPAEPVEEPEEKAPQITNMYLPSIYFTSGRYTVSSKNLGTLSSIATIMRESPEIKVVVTGHTDEVSSEDLNNELSYKRAKAVVDYMIIGQKLPRDRFVIQWKGEKENLVKGNHLVNRRVEFRIAKDSDENMGNPTKK